MSLTRHYLNLKAPDGKSMNFSWQKCRREFLKIVGKQCVLCGYEKHIHVHHVQPRHLFPELAVDHTNLIALCKDCHLCSGHLHHYRNYNKNIRKIAFFANQHNEFGVVDE